MAKKLLVLGASGLTGYKIAGLASGSYDVLGTYNARRAEVRGCRTARLDVTDRAGMEEIFSAFRPDCVINATALHNVDYCEENPERAFSVNSAAVGLMRENCDRHNSRLVHISTDYVFDGSRGSPFPEDEAPAPASKYGESKISGERLLEVKLAREFGFDPGLVRPADSSQLRQKAKRPAFSCLDCSRAARRFGLKLLSTEESLKIMRGQVASESPDLLP